MPRWYGGCHETRRVQDTSHGLHRGGMGADRLGGMEVTAMKIDKWWLITVIEMVAGAALLGATVATMLVLIGRYGL